MVVYFPPNCMEHRNLRWHIHTPCRPMNPCPNAQSFNLNMLCLHNKPSLHSLVYCRNNWLKSESSREKSRVYYQYFTILSPEYKEVSPFPCSNVSYRSPLGSQGFPYSSATMILPPLLRDYSHWWWISRLSCYHLCHHHRSHWKTFKITW